MSLELKPVRPQFTGVSAVRRLTGGELPRQGYQYHSNPLSFPSPTLSPLKHTYFYYSLQEIPLTREKIDFISKTCLCLQQKTVFWFATGGAGFCLSRAMALKMMPYTA